MAQAENVYILITQCLQNGFFLADGNRLVLPSDIVRRMLYGGQPEVVNDDSLLTPDKQNRRQLSTKKVPLPPFTEMYQKGPLYQFFNSLTGPSSNRNHPVHIISVRDWHAPSPYYDEERNLYGSHCEAGTWEAEPIEGFEKFLKPWSDNKIFTDQARSLNGLVCVRSDDNIVPVPEKGEPKFAPLVFYDVRSDSVFDLKAPASTELNKLTHELLATASDPKQATTSHLQLLLDKLIFDHRQKQPDARVYVVMIGAYTDIKIKTLLVGLRTRYAIDGLFVSDVLTDAPTLERHLSGLDFAQKVMQAQIVHNLNDLVSVLNPGAKNIIDDKIIATTVDFREYATYFLDRQNVLAFQDQRLLKYMELTSARSADVYRQIYNANWFLLRIGYIFLALMILLVILRAVGVNIPDALLLSTAGLSVAQILTSFFALPAAQMRNNVNTLVRLRNYLETYSSVTGLLRYHLTKAERLQPKLRDPEFKAQAELELNLLTTQLSIIYKAADQMSKTFYDLAPDETKTKPEEKSEAQEGSNSQQSAAPPGQDNATTPAAPTPAAPPVVPGDGSVG